MDKKIFIEIPVLYYTKSEDNEKETDDCEDCFERAADLGVPPKSLCPECFKKNHKKGEELELVNTYIDVFDIGEYFPLDGGEKTRILTISTFQYMDAELPFDKFLEKIKKVVEIV